MASAIDGATILERVTLIRAALTQADVETAYILTVSLQHALFGADTLEYLLDDPEPAPALAASASGVQTPDTAVAAVAEEHGILEMGGPPEFSLIVTGTLEGPTFAVLSHSGRAMERRRVLDWIGGSPSGAAALGAILERFRIPS